MTGRNVWAWCCPTPTRGSADGEAPAAGAHRHHLDRTAVGGTHACRACGPSAGAGRLLVAHRVGLGAATIVGQQPCRPAGAGGRVDSFAHTLEGAIYGGTSGSQGLGSLSTFMLIHAKTAAVMGGAVPILHETEVLFRPGTRFMVNAIWTATAGRVPADAPPEAQMILHRLGPAKAGVDRNGSAPVIARVRVVELTEV